MLCRSDSPEVSVDLFPTHLEGNITHDSRAQAGDIFEGGQGAEERWFENAVAFGIGYGVLTQGFTGNKA